MRRIRCGKCLAGCGNAVDVRDYRLGTTFLSFKTYFSLQQDDAVEDKQRQRCISPRHFLGQSSSSMTTDAKRVVYASVSYSKSYPLATLILFGASSGD